MAKTPQQKGRDFEKEFAERVGGQPMPGSGNQWYAQMDVQGQTITWSLKFTEKSSIIITRRTIDELLASVLGPGGNGKTPGIAIRVEGLGEDFIIMRAKDFMRLFPDNEPPDKVKQKYDTASIPTLFRD